MTMEKQQEFNVFVGGKKVGVTKSLNLPEDPITNIIANQKKEKELNSLLAPIRNRIDQIYDHTFKDRYTFKVNNEVVAVGSYKEAYSHYRAVEAEQGRIGTEDGFYQSLMDELTTIMDHVLTLESRFNWLLSGVMKGACNTLMRVAEAKGGEDAIMYSGNTLKAAKIFGVAPADVTREMRSQVKALLFPARYGSDGR